MSIHEFAHRALWFGYVLHVSVPFVYDLEASLPVTQLPVHYVETETFVVIQDIDWNVLRTAVQNDSEDLNHGEQISKVWESAIPSKDIEASYRGKECKFILLVYVLSVISSSRYIIYCKILRQ